MRTDQLTENEYHAYYHPYIMGLGDIKLIKGLEESKTAFETFVAHIPDNKFYTAYAAGKWTIAEALLHLIDAERVFQYRALRFARNDKIGLPGFEQDDYVPESVANKRSKKSLIEEFGAVRQGTVTLFKTFNDEILLRKGTANGSLMSVRALGFIICGHQKHHLNVIQERYLQ